MAYQDAPDGWWQDFVRRLPARTAKLAVVRVDGSPHVSPVWVDLDGDDIVFTCSMETVKGRAIRRDGRVSVCLDDEQPPFHFVTISGRARVQDDLDEVRHWATRIAGRYMGEDLADVFGTRNAVPGEMLVRVRAEQVVAKVDVTE